jgi:hypothetical protein
MGSSLLSMAAAKVIFTALAAKAQRDASSEAAIVSCCVSP